MKVYRYENKKDGGGPFCYPDGTSRVRPELSFSNGRLSACTSLSSLKEYFFILHDFTEDDLKDYKIMEYIIPDDKIIFTCYHITFKLDDAISFQPVSTIPDECKGVG